MLRGATTHKARAVQARDFTGLRYGNITPTDIDALIEYKDKAYILIETKYKNAEMPYGQKLALERICDDLQKTKPALLILATHNYEVGEEIDFAHCMVEKYRYKGFWKLPGKTPNVRQLIDSFIESVDK